MNACGEPYTSRHSTVELLKHAIFADQAGEIVPPEIAVGHDECIHASETDDYGSCQIRRVIGELKGFIDSVRESSGMKARVVIFIHGGLNDPRSAAWRAANQIPMMLDDGVYPIFLSWNSSAFDSYWDQIANIRRGQRSKPIAVDTKRKQRSTPHLPSQTNEDEPIFIRLPHQLATPLYFTSDLLNVAARAPSVWSDQLLNLVNKGFSGYKMKDDPVVRENANVFFSQDSDLHDSRAFARRAWFVATTPAKALTVPFVDSFGNTAWENMRRTARSVLWKQELFDRNAGGGGATLSDESWRQGRSSDEEVGYGAFSLFVHRLEKALAMTRKEDTSTYGDAVELNMIAHSMGTIIANEIVRNFNLHFDNITYMAAATTIKQFRDTVVPYMLGQQVPKDDVIRFTGHGTYEEFTKAANAVNLSVEKYTAGNSRLVKVSVSDNLGRYKTKAVEVEGMNENSLGGDSGRTVLSLPELKLNGDRNTRPISLGISLLEGEGGDKFFVAEDLPSTLRQTGYAKPRTCFYNLSLHPDLDAREVTALGFAPRGSLLEWIDAFYNRSPSDLDRTLGKWDNIRKTIRHIDENLQDHILFTVFGKGKEEPTGHSDFDELHESDGPVFPHVCDGYPEVREPTFKYWLPMYWLGKTQGGDESIDGMCIARARAD